MSADKGPLRSEGSYGYGKGLGGDGLALRPGRAWQSRTAKGLPGSGPCLCVCDCSYCCSRCRCHFGVPSLDLPVPSSLGGKKTSSHSHGPVEQVGGIKLQSGQGLTPEGPADGLVGASVPASLSWAAAGWLCLGDLG